MSANLSETKIGFLGLGKMGSAIASGLKARYPAMSMLGYDPFTQSADVSAVANASELESRSDLILLCVKPQEMKAALAGLKGSKQYVSIAAGLGTETIRGLLGNHSARIARVMPNLNAAVHMSATGVFCVDSDLAHLTKAIFESVGLVEFVDKEELLHAVTGLSGSGPAFVFEFLDALAQGGVLAGLPYDRALRLATQTLLGSATLVADKGQHPLELRSAVTSPGGTTIAGLNALEKNGFRAAVMSAVESASKRSKELS
ncbi:MAG: pyrroline-5-carboxylate reductase [Spirochaetia bacterium]|nr:pyrroline-5-carboxylate reductase [Spirochaetia bacterium]